MRKMKAFIADPSETIRRRLKSIILADKDILLAGSIEMKTVEGTISILKEVNPGVLLLGINDVDSKEMQLFYQLRKELPELPIIILPSHNRRGAEIALTALKLGAIEYVIKTLAHSGSINTNNHFNERLIPVIKAIPRMNRRILVSSRSVDQSIDAIERISAEYFTPSLQKMDLLVIAGCLGGVPALYHLLKSLPDNLPVPVMIVQHMPKLFTEVLAEDLERFSGQKIFEAKNDMDLEVGRVYVAPGGYHAVINDVNGKLKIGLNRGPKVKGYRPSIDVMLQSARQVFGNRVLAVYLSGGGHDGVEGAEVIDTAGGRIIIQNRSSSLLWDLPGRIQLRGMEEGAYPLERLGYFITKGLV